MTVTIPCRRCGTQVHVVTDLDAEPVVATVLPHTCYRFLVGECWHQGERISVWDSDEPGRSGPDDLVRNHGKQADAGWGPPAGDGWTYRWQIDDEAVQQAEPL